MMEKENSHNDLVIKDLLGDASNDSAQKDFETARANMLIIAEQGTQAIESLVGIAEQSQHPNAYLALAQMIKSVNETQRELLALQKSIRDIAASSAAVTGEAKNITNNLFVGSTAALQKLLEDTRKKDIME